MVSRDELLQRMNECRRPYVRTAVYDWTALGIAMFIPIAATLVASAIPALAGELRELGKQLQLLLFGGAELAGGSVPAARLYRSLSISRRVVRGLIPLEANARACSKARLSLVDRKFDEFLRKLPAPR